MLEEKAAFDLYELEKEAADCDHITECFCKSCFEYAPDSLKLFESFCGDSSFALEKFKKLAFKSTPVSFNSYLLEKEAAYCDHITECFCKSCSEYAPAGA